jgi:murein DD-endopeptidase MepM/ murein hydrolase activator NlpD
MAAMKTKRRYSGGGTRRKQDSPRPKERRQLAQLVICGSAFVLLVAAKLLLPGRVEQLNARLSEALQQNMDVQSVFSAVGRAFAGEDGMAKEVYQAVFGRSDEAVETVAQVPAVERSAALDTLRTYLPEDAEEGQTGSGELSNLTYVLYSDQNLPENVSMEQAILDFDYCTPVAGVLSSTFGYREHPIEGDERFHYGVDLAADTGTAVGCFADGTVTAVGESSSYGKYCIVSHAGGYSTLYAHCSRVSVSSGTEVTEGQKIAEVGETGMATGPHLHFELHQDSVYLNPIYYVTPV